MPEVEVNGTRLYYQQSGQGPDVVLMHAVTSNQAVWMFTGLVDSLAADFRVTSYALRGHGASDRPPTGYTSAAMAEDFRQLHAALEIEPAYLVGHSFGGVVAMHAALIAPESVAGVVLSDSFFPGLKHVEPNFGKMNIWVDLRETFRKVGVDLGDTVNFMRRRGARRGRPHCGTNIRHHPTRNCPVRRVFALPGDLRLATKTLGALHGRDHPGRQAPGARRKYARIHRSRAEESQANGRRI